MSEDQQAQADNSPSLPDRITQAQADTAERGARIDAALEHAEPDSDRALELANAADLAVEDHGNAAYAGYLAELGREADAAECVAAAEEGGRGWDGNPALAQALAEHEAEVAAELDDARHEHFTEETGDRLVQAPHENCAPDTGGCPWASDPERDADVARWQEQQASLATPTEGRSPEATVDLGTELDVEDTR